MAAAVAAIAGAARRRVIQVFREAGATAPQRAQPLREFDRIAERQLRLLIGQGIVREVEAGYYLDEVVLRAWEQRQRRLGLMLLVLLAVAVLWFQASKGPPVVPGGVYFPPPDPHRLQADEEGYYLPMHEFTVGGFRFEGFSVRPDPLVLFSKVSDGLQHPSLQCDKPLRVADSLHLVCRYPSLGVVSVDGHFPVKEAEDRSSDTLFLGFVTIARSGRTLHHERHAFRFTVGE